MNNKFVKIFLVIFVLILIAIWAPFEEVDLSISRLFGVEQVNKLSSLKVISLKDGITVYMNGEKRGETTPEGGVLEIPDITPGTHIIKLEKISENGEYFEFLKSIDFVDGYSVVIAYELGPTQKFSQGHVLYAKKSANVSDKDETSINIDVLNTQAEIFIDGASIGNSPIRNYSLSLSDIHNVKIVKGGYEDLEFTILPELEDDRKKLKEVDLYIEAQLFLIPLVVE